jgi:hypothetical protein
MSATRYLGFATRYATRLVDSRERAQRVAALLMDPRWPWPPKSFSTGVVGSFTKRTRTRKVGPATGQKRLLDSILDPSTRVLLLSTHSLEAKDHAHLRIETGTYSLSSWEQPFRADGQTRAHDLPAGKTVENWIHLVHELIETLDVASAILPLYETATAVLADTSLTSIVSESRWNGRTDLGPGEDFSAQNDRAQYWRDLLGATYVRNARWGTYLRDHHVEAIGGLDRIRREVEPARVTVLGPLVYFQLTETVDEGLTDACEAKRRAFDVLLAPILPPPIPPHTP